jgi:hypothetical protein
MRPPTHDDPNAIPRNGTDVPWVDLPEPRPEEESERTRAGLDEAAAASDGDRVPEGPPARR